MTSTQTNLALDFPPTAVDPDEEILATYLDGELSPEKKRDLEDRLVQDQELRKKMATFEETWGALQLLETSQTDPNFVRSTMELVAVRAEDEIEAISNRAHSGKKGSAMFFLLGLICTALIGYGSVHFLFARNQQKMLENLPIIEHLDQYLLLEEQRDRSIDEIDFLRKLNESKILD